MPKGGYIDLAAPGVDIWAGTESGKGQYYRGSSFAAPYVAAAASLIGSNAEKRLYANAKDLGNSGRDDTYGYGLIQVSGLDCPAAY
jgi:subtilisin family serine protease